MNFLCKSKYRAIYITTEMHLSISIEEGQNNFLWHILKDQQAKLVGIVVPALLTHDLMQTHSVEPEVCDGRHGLGLAEDMCRTNIYTG